MVPSTITTSAISRTLRRSRTGALHPARCSRQQHPAGQRGSIEFAAAYARGIAGAARAGRSAGVERLLAQPPARQYERGPCGNHDRGERQQGSRGDHEHGERRIEDRRRVVRRAAWRKAARAGSAAGGFGRQGERDARVGDVLIEPAELTLKLPNVFVDGAQPRLVKRDFRFARGLAQLR